MVPGVQEAEARHGVPRLRQRTHSGAEVLVPAHLADELDVPAQPLRRDRLVGSFAAGAHGEDAAQHGLTWPGQGLGLGSHVRVAAAQDQNLFIIHKVWC